jgi:hypothetical protein
MVVGEDLRIDQILGYGGKTLKERFYGIQIAEVSLND